MSTYYDTYQHGMTRSQHSVTLSKRYESDHGATRSQHGETRSQNGVTLSIRYDTIST